MSDIAKYRRLTRPALPEPRDAMTVADIEAHRAAMQAALGAHADMAFGMGSWNHGKMSVNFYPHGITRDLQSVRAASWPELLAAAWAWIDARPVRAREAEIARLDREIAELQRERRELGT